MLSGTSLATHVPHYRCNSIQTYAAALVVLGRDLPTVLAQYSVLSPTQPEHWRTYAAVY